MQAVTYEAKGATSVAWNLDYEDMLCYSGGGQLTIHTAGCAAAITQKMGGFAVGFKVGACWRAACACSGRMHATHAAGQARARRMGTPRARYVCLQRLGCRLI